MKSRKEKISLTLTLRKYEFLDFIELGIKVFCILHFELKRVLPDENGRKENFGNTCIDENDW